MNDSTVFICVLSILILFLTSFSAEQMTQTGPMIETESVRQPGSNEQTESAQQIESTKRKGSIRQTRSTQQIESTPQSGSIRQPTSNVQTRSPRQNIVPIKDSTHLARRQYVLNNYIPEEGRAYQADALVESVTEFFKGLEDENASWDIVQNAFKAIILIQSSVFGEIVCKQLRDKFAWCDLALTIYIPYLVYHGGQIWLCCDKKAYIDYYTVNTSMPSHHRSARQVWSYVCEHYPTPGINEFDEGARDPEVHKYRDGRGKLHHRRSMKDLVKRYPKKGSQRFEYKGTKLEIEYTKQTKEKTDTKAGTEEEVDTIMLTIRSWSKDHKAIDEFLQVGQDAQMEENVIEVYKGHLTDLQQKFEIGHSIETIELDLGLRNALVREAERFFGENSKKFDGNIGQPHSLDGYCTGFPELERRASQRLSLRI